MNEMVAPFVVGFVVGAASVFALGFMVAIFHFFNEELKNLLSIYTAAEESAAKEKEKND